MTIEADPTIAPAAPQAPRDPETFSLRDVIGGMLKANAVLAQPKQHAPERVQAADRAIFEAGEWASMLTFAGDETTRQLGLDLVSSIYAEEQRRSGKLAERMAHVTTLRQQAEAMRDGPVHGRQLVGMEDAERDAWVATGRLKQATFAQADALEGDIKELWRQSARLYGDGVPITEISETRTVTGGIQPGTLYMPSGISGTNANAAIRQGSFNYQVLTPDNELQTDEHGQQYLYTERGRINVPDWSHKRDEIRKGLMGLVPGTGGTLTSENVSTALAERVAGAVVGGWQGWLNPQEAGAGFGMLSASGVFFPVVPELYPDSPAASRRALQDPAHLRGVMEVVRELQEAGDIRPTTMEAMLGQLGSVGEFIVTNQLAGLGLKTLGGAAAKAGRAAGMKHVPFLTQTGRLGGRALTGGYDKRYLPGLQFGARDIGHETVYGAVQALATGDRSAIEGGLSGAGEGFVEFGAFLGWRMGSKAGVGASRAISRKLLGPEPQGAIGKGARYLGDRLDALKKSREGIHRFDYVADRLDKVPFKNSTLRFELERIIGNGQTAELLTKGMDGAAVYTILGAYHGARASMSQEEWDQLDKWGKFAAVMDNITSPEAIGGGMAAVATMGGFAALERSGFGKWREQNELAAQQVESMMRDYANRITNPTPEFAFQAIEQFDKWSKMDPTAGGDLTAGLYGPPKPLDFTEPWARGGDRQTQSVREVQEVQPEETAGKVPRPPKGREGGRKKDRRSVVYQEERRNRFEPVELSMGTETERGLSWKTQVAGAPHWWQHRDEPSVGVRRRFRDGSYVVVDMTPDVKRIDTRVPHTAWFESLDDAMAQAHVIAEHRFQAADMEAKLPGFVSGKMPAADMKHVDRLKEHAQLQKRLERMDEADQNYQPEYEYAELRIIELEAANASDRESAARQRAKDAGPLLAEAQGKPDEDLPPDLGDSGGNVPRGGGPAGPQGPGGSPPFGEGVGGALDVAAPEAPAEGLFAGTEGLPDNLADLSDEDLGDLFEQTEPGALGDVLLEEMDRRTSPAARAETDVEYEEVLAEAGDDVISGELDFEQLEPEVAEELEARGLNEETVRDPEAQANWDETVQTMAAEVLAEQRKPLSPAAVQESLREVADLSGVGIELLSVLDIGIDPKTFQFKIGADPKTGVREDLGFEVWDPKKAKTFLVWEDGQGRKWVVDGHHRIAKAKALGVESVPAFVMRETEGVSRNDAMAEGAAINIAEGNATAIDAARFLRSSDEYTPEKLREMGVSMTPGTLGHQAIHLATLGDMAWEEVWTERVRADLAAIVGKEVPGREQDVKQRQMIDIVRDARSQAEARERVRAANSRYGEMQATQEGLFGEEEISRMLIKETGKVTQNIKKRLREDKSAFRSLMQNTRRFEESGAAKTDKQRAQEMREETDRALVNFDAFQDKTWHPIGKIINQAAAALGEGAKIKEVTDRALDQLSRLDWDAIDRTAFGADAPTPDAPPVEGGLFSTGADLPEGSEAILQAEQKEDDRASLEAHRYDPGLVGRSDAEKLDAIKGMLPEGARSKADRARGAPDTHETIDQAAEVKRRHAPPPPDEPKRVRAMAQGETAQTRFLQMGEAAKRLREIVGTGASPDDAWNLAMGGNMPGLDPNVLLEAQQVARELFSFVQMTAHEAVHEMDPGGRLAEVSSQTITDYFDVSAQMTKGEQLDGAAVDRLVENGLLVKDPDTGEPVWTDTGSGDLRKWFDGALQHLYGKRDQTITDSFFSGIDPSILAGPLRAVRDAFGRIRADGEIEGNEVLPARVWQAKRFQDSLWGGRLGEATADWKASKALRGTMAAARRMFGRQFDSISLSESANEMNRRALYEVFRPGEAEAAEVSFETNAVLAGMTFGEYRRPVEHQEAFVKLIDSGAMRKITGPADVEAMFGPGTGYLFDHAVRMSNLIDRIGRRMVELGNITEDQRAKWAHQYVMRSYLDLTEDDVYERLSKGEGISVFMPNRDMARGFEAKQGAMLITNPEMIFTRQNAQEAYMVRLFSMLQGLVSGGMAIPMSEVRSWAPWQREHWVTPAIEGDVESPARDPLHGQRAHGAQYRLHYQLKTMRDSMQSAEDAKNGVPAGKGQHVWTQAKEDMLNDYLDGEYAITSGMSDEIDFFLSQFEDQPTRYGNAWQAMKHSALVEHSLKRMEETARYWRRARTVQNPVHWSLNIISSVGNNHLFGQVSMWDFTRSMLTGRGQYADAMSDLHLYQQWLDGGKERGFGTAEERQRLRRVQTVVEEIMGGTFVANLIDAPGLQNVIGSAINRDAQTEALHREIELRGDMGSMAALKDAAADLARRSSQGQGQYDIALGKLLGSNNPEMQAEAVSRWTSQYQQWELLFKYTGALNQARKNKRPAGVSEEQHLRNQARRSVIATAEYSNTSPLLRRWQALQVSNLAKQHKGLTAKTTRGAGTLAVAGALTGSPFWLYDTVMMPAKIRAMASHPGRAIAVASMALVAQEAVMKALGTSEEEHWEQFAQLAGAERHESTPPFPPRALELLEERGEHYLPAPGGFAGGFARGVYTDLFRHLKRAAMGEVFTAPTLPRNGRTRFTSTADLAPGIGDITQRYKGVSNAFSGQRNPGRALLEALYGFYPQAGLALARGSINVAAPGDRSSVDVAGQELLRLSTSMAPAISPRGILFSRQGVRFGEISLLQGQDIGSYMRGQTLLYHPSGRQRLAEYITSTLWRSESAVHFDRLRQGDGWVSLFLKEAVPRVNADVGEEGARFRRSAKLVKEASINLVRGAYTQWRSGEYGQPNVTTFDGILAKHSNLYADMRWNTDLERYELKPDHEPQTIFGKLAAKQKSPEGQRAVLETALGFVMGPAWDTRGRNVLLGMARDRTIDPDMLARYYDAAVRDPGSRGLRILMHQDLIRDGKTDRALELYPLFSAVGAPGITAGSTERDQYRALLDFFEPMRDMHMPPQQAPELLRAFGPAGVQAGYEPTMLEIGAKER